jgi:hypothetical protein
MKLAVSAVALALAMSTGMALAQSNKSDVTVPSAQNSGAGISGHPGNKNGPPAKTGTVGSSAADQSKGAVKEQDSAKIQGLPGNKSGPAVKPPSH